MTDFEYDVLERKRLAGQARHRKRGSKSKKCPLSTDRMTEKQWKERCGPVQTYNLKKPMAMSDFKQMPEDLQKKYLEYVMETYGANATDLAFLLHAHPVTVRRLCTELGVVLRKGARMNGQQRAAFEEFSRGDSIPVESEPVEVPSVDEPSSGRPMVMSEFAVEFTGEFSPETVYNSLATLVQRGTNVKLSVRCEFLPGNLNQ